MREYSLFNALDGSLVSLNLRAFEYSLVMNVLFQERILVFDNSLFTCQNLLEHLTRRPGFPALFEVAGKRGLIVPAIRDPNAETLGEATRSLPAGTMPEIRVACGRAVSAIDTAIRSGLTTPFRWPSGGPMLGETYRDTVLRLLSRDSPPTYTQANEERASYFQRLWEHTERWRFDVVYAAVKRTVDAGHQGLRRQEVFNELARVMGLNIGRDVFYTDLMAGCRTAEDSLAMEVFLRWLAQCHFVNQARSFDVSINFPVYHIDEDFILDSILPVPADRKEPETNSKTIRADVDLPDISLLTSLDPNDLVAIRIELGDYYLQTLRDWQKEPTTANEAKVREALTDYCVRLTARYKMLAKVKVEVSLWKGKFGRMIDQALSFVPSLPVQVLHKASKAGAVGYAVIKELALEKVQTVRKQTIEITLDEGA